MISPGARAYNEGLGGFCPQWVQGASTLVRGHENEVPPEAQRFLTFVKRVFTSISTT
jgi:hypothetical protein